jgi:phage shock protein PspC (stress-responsive transcriptional regulator)
MLYRNQNQAIVTGVAAGLAEHFNISKNLIRTLFVIGSLYAGLGIVAYLFLSAYMSDQSNQTHFDFQ